MPYQMNICPIYIYFSKYEESEKLILLWMSDYFLVGQNAMFIEKNRNAWYSYGQGSSGITVIFLYDYIYLFQSGKIN